MAQNAGPNTMDFSNIQVTWTKENLTPYVEMVQEVVLNYCHPTINFALRESMTKFILSLKLDYSTALLGSHIGWCFFVLFAVLAFDLSLLTSAFCSNVVSSSYSSGNTAVRLNLCTRRNSASLSCAALYIAGLLTTLSLLFVLAHYSPFPSFRHSSSSRAEVDPKRSR
jgi:hypothetical protein